MSRSPAFINAAIAVISTITFLILITPSVIEMALKRNDDGHSALCSSSFCYEQSSTSQSCLTPESWSSLPCRRGVVNECNGIGTQSPININTGSGSDDDINDNCISLISYDDDDDDEKSNSLGIASFEMGNCTFEDLTSTLNIHKSIQIDYPSSCRKPTLSIPSIQDEDYIKNDAEDWELIQFHFHVGSEHTFDDIRLDGEFHLVHQSLETGKLLVVAVPVQRINYYDDDSMFLDASDVIEPLIQASEFVAKNMWSACYTMRSVYAENHKSPFEVSHSMMLLSEYVDQDWNIYDVLTGNNCDNVDDSIDNAYSAVVGAFSYIGSLTTPPCSTGVQWHVLDKPMGLSSNQIYRLSHLIGGFNCPAKWPSCQYETIDYKEEGTGTFRPIQELGNRQLLHFCAL